MFSGVYGVHLKFDEQHIPNSPFMVNISPDSVEAKMVEVHGFKDRGLMVSILPKAFTNNEEPALLPLSVIYFLIDV